MCGRFALGALSEDIKQKFQLFDMPILRPRYNIAPGQYIPVIRNWGKLELMLWGLTPKWLTNKDGGGYINAKLETADEKPAFKYAVKKQRVLIVADGFYEWKPCNNYKQPYYVKRKDGDVFCFAGIWDNDGCAILTTQASGDFAALHERAPCIISSTDYQAWLHDKWGFDAFSARLARETLVEYKFFPVSTQVNSPSNDNKSCISQL